MKKYIFTESQVKKIISNEINEQVSPQSNCVETVLKNSILENKTPQLLKALASGKFKVTDIVGDVKLNGKPYDRNLVQKGIVLTPETTVTICVGSSIIMSGMGLKQCGLVHGPNGVVFIPQIN